MLRRTIPVKVRPSAEQVQLLGTWLGRCRNLYNACLEQRITAYRQSKTWPTKPGRLTSLYGQSAQLPALKEDNPEFKDVNAQVLQDVVHRVDKAFQAFFKRNRTVKTGGFPRFKSAQRFSSFTHPQGSKFKFENNSFYLPSFGWLKFWNPGEGSRPFSTCKVKTVTIKRLADGWWASFSVEVIEPRAVLAPAGKAVGIDLGLTNFVTCSDGTVYGDLKPIKREERKIRLCQRSLSRKVKGSNRWRKQKVLLGKRHLRLDRMRRQQFHFVSRKIVNENDLIAVEDLDVAGMVSQPAKPGSVVNQRGLRRNIGLAAWAQFVWMLDYKAEEAGRRVMKVDPRGTSQECSSCGRVVKKDLRVRLHDCPHCGLRIDRDLNAARNILARGLKQTGGIPPSLIPKGTCSPDDLKRETVPLGLAA